MSDDRAVDQVHCEGDGVKCEHPEGGFILEGVVSVSGTEKQLTLKHDGLVLGSKVTGASSKTNKDLNLLWEDVISAVKDAQPKSGKQIDSFMLHYIKHHDNNKLQVQHVQITVGDGQTDKWISAVNETCQKVPGRPKKAFVIINPIGGSKTGQKMYQKKIAPLFELAGIHTTVKVTERSKHAIELGEQEDFSGYDAIVIVGGDGLYQEVLQGYTVRTQKDAGVDYDDPEASFIKPKVPFGIIPAGTGNGIAKCCNGAIDEVTSALNIIRGETHKTMVLTVHSCGKFVTLSSMIFAYGEFTDLMKHTDDLRWMGRLRYPYAMLGMLFKKPRMFNGTMEYLVAANDENQDLDGSSCEAGARRSDWIAYTGNNGNCCGFFSFTFANILDKHVNMLSHGNCTDLFIDFGCGRIDLMKTVYKCTVGKNTIESKPEKLDIVSRIIGFRFRLNSDVTGDESPSSERVKERELECLLNIDGEVVRVNRPEFEVRVHPEFVSLYATQKAPGTSKDT